MLAVQGLLVAISIASMLTAIFAFRFRAWHRRGLLALYFAFFLVLEGVLSWLFLPPGVMGVEVGYVCVAITALFVLAGHVVRNLERNADRDG
ncbi:MAG: hypothetical protein B7733_15305 [Myxococcales bacterium FL481]|nr:MAG: hypothetical protein B7733_15305 [Myxococcales bacterium FL481]